MSNEIEQQPASGDVGDVFQINEKHGRMGWVGAFVMATEIKSWGIEGFVSHVETHEQQNRAYIRLKWEELDYIGHAQLVPGDAAPCSADGESSDLSGIFIPSNLEACFDDFLVMAISALDGTSCRKDWTDDERAIVEWFEEANHTKSSLACRPRFLTNQDEPQQE